MAEIVGGIWITEYEFTRSWGTEAGSASGKGVIAAGDSSEGLAVGDYYVYSFGGITFHGLMSSASQAASREGGYEYPFQLVDNRVRLVWAVVFGQWNMAEDPSMVHADDWPAAPLSSTHQGSSGDGVDFDAGVGSYPPIPSSSLTSGEIARGRLFGHIPPSQWATQVKSYTSAPMSAAQILDQAFRGALGGYQFSLDTHAAQNRPVFNIDANGGMSLAALVSQVTEAQGLQMTITGQKTLKWGRRGEGTLVIPPPPAHVISNGLAMSSDATKVRVVGERVLVQMNNIAMEPDWNSEWEAFVSEPAWLAEVSRVLGGGSDTAAARAELAALAREISLRQYLAASGTGGTMADYGRWGKVSRMDIPCWVYINSIVYRSYRIPNDAMIFGMRARDWPLHDSLLCAVEVSGAAGSTAIRYRTSPVELYPQGAAYVIAKGQPLDLLSAADRTAITRLRTRDMRAEWSEIADFTVDPLNHSIRFASPVFLDGDPGSNRSILCFPNQGEGGFDDLGEDADDSDYAMVAVPNPDYQISAAEVRCSLVFRLGKFHQDFGSGARYTVHNTELAEHLLHSSGGSISHSSIKSYTGNLRVPAPAGSLSEILYEDGSTAAELAESEADGLIVKGGVEQSGRYERHGAAGTALTGMIDRVSIRVTHGDGIVETVEFAKPRPTDGFRSSRDVALRFRTEELFEGQADLRREVRLLKGMARLERMTINDKPRSTSHLTISDVFKRPIGSESPECATYADPDSQYPTGQSGWKAGNLVWLDGKGLPSRTGGAFGGVVVSSTAAGSKHVNVATSGTVPMLVAVGSPGGSTVYADPGSATAGSGGAHALGVIAHAEAVPGTGELGMALVRLWAGGGGGGGNVIPPLTIVSSKPPYIPTSGEAADGKRRYWVTRGAVNGRMTQNWNTHFDVNESIPVTYFAIKVLLSGNKTAANLVSSSELLMSEALSDFNSPDWGAEGERPSHAFFVIGGVYNLPGGDVPTASIWNEGGGSFVVTEHVTSILSGGNYGAASVTKSLFWNRNPY